MHPVFHDDFSGNPDGAHPDGWDIERHSALRHNHACVKEGSLALMLPGNKHMPRTPPLDDFTMDISCRGDRWFDDAAGILVYFRYDPETRRGYYMHCRWGAEGIAAGFGIHAGGTYSQLQSRQLSGAFEDASRPCRLRLDVSGGRFALSCDGRALEPFHDAGKAFSRGRVAFDNYAAAGARHHRVPALGSQVFLDSVRIESKGEFPAREVLPPFRVAFPHGLNGMQKPFEYQIGALEIGGCFLLNVRLTGGETDVKPGFAGGFYTCNEEMTRPYVRLEYGGGRECGPFFLLNGTVGVREPRDKKNFMFFPADAEVPLERTVRLDESPAEARLFIGYDFYQHEAAAHLRGGPTEAWVDIKNGRVRYAGAPLRSGCRVIEIRSPEDKEICRNLPRDEPRYEQALAFARCNHYFMEKESCSFTVFLRLRHASFIPGEWTLRARLEDAFLEPHPAGIHCEPRQAEDPLSAEMREELGVETLMVEVRVQEELPPGVYHLSARWFEGGGAAVEKRVAFEVMPADPCAAPAPLASGLPALHSWPDEAAGLATNSFDPWAGEAVDASHYMTDAYYHPEFARRNRVWKLLHFYGRKLRFQARYSCSEDDKNPLAPAAREMIANADYVSVPPLRINARNDLWKRSAYRGVLLEAFNRFVEEGVPDAGERGVLLETESPGGGLSAGAFQALLKTRWKAWLAWFCDYAYCQYREIQDYVKALNPRALMFFGAWYPAYASVYKGAYFFYCIGVDPGRIPAEPQGPGLLEDYPLLCRYSMHRGVYQLSVMKMAAPSQCPVVEMYGWCSTPVDGALLFGNPPYSRFDPPAPYFRKRLLDFAYAAVWFGKEGFAYWDDHRFHARFWKREHFEVLLSTWAVVRGSPPLRPLRTTAFASSLQLCWNHPDDYIPDKPGGYPWGDVFNTAEESTAYAYEQARGDGQLAGFLLDLDYIGRIDPAVTDTVVLPPLKGAAPRMLKAIRAKHEEGVNLMGFEDVAGLEDLFGVAPFHERVPVKIIQPNPACDIREFRMLPAGLREACDHHGCSAPYRADGADTALEGLGPNGRAAGPVLAANRTRWGRTALFCIPPTIVNRADQLQTCQYGQECLSVLMNRAAAAALRWLGSPAVETTDGKIVAFRDVHGRARVIVMEDAWPDTPRTIEPRVTVRLPEASPESVDCDRPFAVLDHQPGWVALRLRLEPHESAVITFKGR